MLDKGDIMKKLFLIMAVILGIIILTTPMYAQAGKNMVIFSDTTQLKASEEGGIVLLEQFGGYGTYDRTGGGLFHFADSSIAEGTHAFDHPLTGKQWQRIQYTGGEEQEFATATIAGLLTVNDRITADTLHIGTTASPIALVAGTDQVIEVNSTTSTTSGNHWAIHLFNHNTATTTGSIGTLWVENNVTAQAAGQNAGYFRLDMNAVQAPTGGASTLNAELIFPTGSQNGGSYHPFVVGVQMDATTDQFYNAAIPSGFIKMDVWGATDDEWNECANAFTMNGIVDTENGMFEAETVATVSATHVLRINIGGVAYYIALNTAKTM